MPEDESLERVNDELRAARQAVQDHLSTAVRAWRNLPPTEPLVAITSSWLDEHEALKERVEDLERQVTDVLQGR
jgi:hypothetical protein